MQQDEASREVAERQGIARDLLLATRFHVPRLPAKLVQRVNLIRRLQQALENPLSLVAAPAGSGKTTLLSMWLQSAPVAAAWISLSVQEDDLVPFWSSTLTALNSIQPDLCEAAITMLLSLHPPGIETVLTSVIHALLAVSREIVLVLDDYHLITTPAIHQAMTFFLEHLPPHLHLIIATREDPPLPLARLRTRGQLVELRFTDLRFTQEEAAVFFHQLELDLSLDEVRALGTRTEGWIAGLQLAALSLQGRTDRADFIRNFTGNHRYIVDYLVQEVLAHLSASVQAFLLPTSILERLHGPLCDAVTGQQHGQEQLEALEQANLFVLPLDDERQWYRYHHLFADVLRRRLGSLSAAEHENDGQAPVPVPELHRRAAAWYEQHEYFTEAISHLKAANDLEQVACLIEQHGMPLIQRGELAILLRWIDALPFDLVRGRLRLCLIHAEALAYSGLLEAAEARLHDVEALLHADSEQEKSQAQAIQGEIFAMHAMIVAYWGIVDQTLAFAAQAEVLLPPDSELHGVLAMSLGMVYKRVGEYRQSYAAFSHAQELSRTKNTHIEMMCIANRALILQREGQLHEAEKVYQQALHLTQPRKIAPAACMAYLGMGDLLREWNDLEAAARHLQTGLALSKLWGYAGMVVEISIVMAKVCLALGHVEEAFALLEEARRFSQEHRDLFALTNLQAFEARLHLALGQRAFAVKWKQEVDFSLLQRSEAAMVGEHFLVQARLDLASGSSQEALTLLERLLEEEETHERGNMVIKILLLQALVYQQQQKDSLALTKLARALTLAEPEGYIRIFVDEGPPLAELLHLLRKLEQKGKQAQEWKISPTYVNQLLAFMVPEEADEQVGEALSASTGLLVDPLSEREMEVLREIAAGYSNREIATKLVVAVSTVKSHVNIIYRKLQVESRTQAVARGRALRLLPE